LFFDYTRKIKPSCRIPIFLQENSIDTLSVDTGRCWCVQPIKNLCLPLFHKSNSINVFAQTEGWEPYSVTAHKTHPHGRFFFFIMSMPLIYIVHICALILRRRSESSGRRAVSHDSFPIFSSWLILQPILCIQWSFLPHRSLLNGHRTTQKRVWNIKREH